MQTSTTETLNNQKTPYRRLLVKDERIDRLRELAKYNPDAIGLMWFKVLYFKFTKATDPYTAGESVIAYIKKHVLHLQNVDGNNKIRYYPDGKQILRKMSEQKQLNFLDFAHMKIYDGKDLFEYVFENIISGHVDYLIYEMVYDVLKLQCETWDKILNDDPTEFSFGRYDIPIMIEQEYLRYRENIINSIQEG